MARPRIEDQDKTAEARKPWLSAGMSRRTWYYRRKEAKENPMPTIRGYGKKQPKRLGQRDFSVDSQEPIPIRVRCNCGVKGAIEIPAKKYFKPGFKPPRWRCSECQTLVDRGWKPPRKPRPMPNL